MYEMTTVRSDDDYILDTLTKEVNLKLQTINKNISHKKSELTKAEYLLLQFQNSLAEQNNELNRFVKEGREIERDIAANSNRGIRCVVDSSKRGTDERVVIMRENSDNRINGVEPLSDNSSQRMQSFQTFSKLCEDEIQPKPLDILELKTFTVFTIKCFCNMVLLGGTNGLLMSYECGMVTKFETNTQDTIVQIELLKLCGKVALVGFTNDKVIVFRDMVDNKTCKEIDLPGMVHAYNEGNLIYVSLIDGSIKKLSKEFWKLTDYTESSFVMKRIVFTVTLSNKYILVRLQDNQIYKTQFKSLQNLQLIRSLKDVRVVLKLKTKGFLCYSTDKLWLLDKSCDIVDSKEVKNGISFVDSDGENVVVIDANNLVGVYPVSKSCTFEPGILEKSVEGDITAVSITPKLIYYALGDEVFSIGF